jgi:hypothetical protein
MNVERAQYVLMHKRLLHIARTSATATGPALEVRLVQVVLVYALANHNKDYKCNLDEPKLIPNM